MKIKIRTKWRLKVRRLKQFIIVASAMAFAAIFLFYNNVYATEGGGISGSKLATGTQNLIQDTTTWLMIIAPIAAGLLILYFCIRRGAADEMDQSAATRCCQ